MPWAASAAAPVALVRRTLVGPHWRSGNPTLLVVHQPCKARACSAPRRRPPRAPAWKRSPFPTARCAPAAARSWGQSERSLPPGPPRTWRLRCWQQLDMLLWAVAKALMRSTWTSIGGLMPAARLLLMVVVRVPAPSDPSTRSRGFMNRGSAEAELRWSRPRTAAVGLAGAIQRASAMQRGLGASSASQGSGC